jgi:ribosomal protein S18 acetylase RimI-like enzyme
MQKIKFRMATADDVDQLIGLRILMQCEVHHKSTDQVDSEYRQVLRDYFIQNLQSGIYASAVADNDGCLVSANGLIIYQKPPSITGGRGLTGYISNVYTLPEFRKRGIASELMNLLIKYSQDSGLDKLHLGATEDGKDVYERVGFKFPTSAPLELKLR